MKLTLKLTALGIFLAAVLTAILPMSALAATFEPRLEAPNSGIDYYNSTLNVYSQNGYGMPNCTAYVYGRIYEITGEAPLIDHGDAEDWYYINKYYGYYEYGTEPRLGAIACWSNHVAVVEEIDGDTVTVSQSHWYGAYFDTYTFTSGDSRYGQTFYGYIYASDSALEEGEDEALTFEEALENSIYYTDVAEVADVAEEPQLTNCFEIQAGALTSAESAESDDAETVDTLSEKTFFNLPLAS